MFHIFVVQNPCSFCFKYTFVPLHQFSRFTPLSPPITKTIINDTFLFRTPCHEPQMWDTRSDGQTLSNTARVTTATASIFRIIETGSHWLETKECNGI